MLSRVAENLFWMGRYIERSEHLARYLNVQYFSSIEVPYHELRERALFSIYDMVSQNWRDLRPLEEEILVSVAFNERNPESILSTTYYGRENARIVRDSISTEVWEAINNNYLFVSGFSIDYYKARGLYDFTSQVIDHCSIIRGKIHHTLLHDVAWNFVQLGMHLERATQLIRILISKLNEINELQDYKVGVALETQQWNILLDCAEAKDMCRKFYNSLPDRFLALEFLLLNPRFPRSVVYNLTHAHNILGRINPTKMNHKGSLEFKVGKIINHFTYLEIEDIQDDVIPFLEDTRKKIYQICDLIVDEYFKH